MSTRIVELLEQKNGGNQSEMARFIGVSPQAVQKWIAGATEPRGANLEKAAEFLGVTPSVLKFGGNLNRDGKVIRNGRVVHPMGRRSTDISNDVDDGPAIRNSLRMLPILGRVQAGPDGLLHIDDYPNGDGYMMWWSKCPESYALRIRGESMSPRYLPGEFVGVDPCAEVTPSDEVIVLLKSGERMFKRLLWSKAGQVCLESINKLFPNIILDTEEIDRLHLVLGHIPKAAFNPG